ncbi:MAG TPA: transglycosylase SLT domain-containing protein [Burkholderiales bacterium]|nr:transglycosylase SLT domain-containing protein [Burkholderiales bacterium]
MRTFIEPLKAELGRLYRVLRGALALLGLVTVVAVAMPLPQAGLEVQAAIASLVGGGTAAAPDLALQEHERPAGVECVPTPLQAVIEDVPAAIAWFFDGGTAATLLAEEQRAVAEFIARRYRVAEAASSTYVSSAYRSGLAYSVDPLLILAVMAIESSYNPEAESHRGARGLMQIIPRWHPEKLAEHGGESALLDPEVNIQVGARILREYMARAGEMQAALQMYNGARDEPTARYAGKVLAEKARLRQFLVAALDGG